MSRKEENKTMVEELLREADALVLNRDQRARLRHALSLERPGSSKRDRRRAGEIAQAVRRELGSQMAASLAVEIKAGGEVSDFNDDGAKRLSSRDGLLNLWMAKRINDDLAAAGLAYRRAHEAEGKMVSQLGDSQGDGGSDPVWSALKRAKLGVQATVVDITVALELKHRPDALDALRRVAGNGQCLGSMAQGRAFEHRLEGLILALQIAARRLRPTAT